MTKLVDIKEMPNWNSKSGLHGTDSVSTGKVFWTEKNKATCHIHGAMNKMSPEGIWRCIMCNEGAYEVKEAV